MAPSRTHQPLMNEKGESQTKLVTSRKRDGGGGGGGRGGGRSKDLISPSLSPPFLPPCGWLFWRHLPPPPPPPPPLISLPLHPPPPPPLLLPRHARSLARSEQQTEIKLLHCVHPFAKAGWNLELGGEGGEKGEMQIRLPDLT